MTDVTMPAGSSGWRQARAAALAAAARSGRAARGLAAKARTHKITLALPGLAGMALISASAGLRLGVWAGLGVAGVFCLRLDARL